MRIIHVCNGWEKSNGAANIARLIGEEQRLSGHEVVRKRWIGLRTLRSADEIWIHCGWMPCLWWAAFGAFHFGCETVRIMWVPEACYDPIRLKFHGWKKRLAGPIERFCLRLCDVIVATCGQEKKWILEYLGAKCPQIEVTNICRFFNFKNDCFRQHCSTQTDDNSRLLHVLYLGRRHPLKGVEFLERAVRELVEVGSRTVELRIVSDHFGEELEKDWAWCDVLCLPTLSDNLGLVVAEALERGKRVITTDGAPAWAPPEAVQSKSKSKSGVEQWRDRLLYLNGFRDGTDEERVRLLKGALEGLLT